MYADLRDDLLQPDRSLHDPFDVENLYSNGLRLFGPHSGRLLAVRLEDLAEGPFAEDSTKLIVIPYRRLYHIGLNFWQP